MPLCRRWEAWGGLGWFRGRGGGGGEASRERGSSLTTGLLASARASSGVEVGSLCARCGHPGDGRETGTQRRQTRKGGFERSRTDAESEPERRVQTPQPAGPAFPAAGHCFSFLFFFSTPRTGRRSEGTQVQVPPPVPEGEGPRPHGRGARKGWGEAGTEHKGKCGGERVRKQEEPRSRLPPQRGEGPALAPPLPPSPDAPKAPPACERKQNTNHLQRHRLLRRHRPVTSPPQPPPLPPWA